MEYMVVWEYEHACQSVPIFFLEVLCHLVYIDIKEIDISLNVRDNQKQLYEYLYRKKNYILYII